MRILIVSYYFPPYMNVGGFRAMSWARRFHDRGHEVIVIHGDGQEAASCDYFNESLDRDVRTIRVHNPMLEQASRIGEAAPKARIVDRFKDSLRPYLPIVDSYMLWSKAAVSAALEETRKDERFDAVISTSFPLSAHEVARKVKRATGCVWAADFRDFYGQFDSNSLTKASPRTRFLARRFATYGREADFVLTVSEKLKELVDKAMRITGTMVLYNGYFEEHLPSDSPAVPRWRILYTGSYNESEFTVAPLAKALSAWPEDSGEKPEVCFTGSPIPSVRKAFHDIGVEVRFLGALDNREVLRLQAEAAFLLICDPMSGPGALLTKTFEYLAARRPIIGISRAGSDLRTGLFAAAAPGYCLTTDAEEVLAFLLTWKDGFAGKNIHEAFYPREFIQKYSREFQADLLVDKLEIALAGRKGTDKWRGSPG